MNNHTKICHRSGKIVSVNFQCKNCKCSKSTKKARVLTWDHLKPYIIVGGIMVILSLVMAAHKDPRVAKDLDNAVKFVQVL